MTEAIPFALWSWVPASLFLFWKLPSARAAVASLVGGWLVLPTARFGDDAAGVAFPYWIMPACLPSDVWTTKARVVGVSLLLGVAAFDPGAWRRFRPSWFDLPMLAWCLVPIPSGLANGLRPAEIIADSAYLALAWGVPYLAGRVYFADEGGLDELARGLVAGGLVSIPFGLVELAIGPAFYRFLYGFHPYQCDGSARYVGYRPILLLEHGNQLGIVDAASALVAAWLWRSGKLRRFWGMPGGLVAGALVVQAILTQSAGAILLLVAGLSAMEALRRLDRLWPLAVVAGLLLAVVAARAANLVDAKGLAMRTAAGRAVAGALVKADRGSLGWRLRVEERSARVALRKPALGWARWDWWRVGPGGERPWGLPSLALGMYGLAGWAALLGVFVGPVSAFLTLGSPRSWATSARAAAAALAGAVALIGLDAILNPCVFLPVVAASGGLVGLRAQARARSARPGRAGPSGR